MPVIIKDFEVVSEEPTPQEPAIRSNSPTPSAPKPLSPRQLSRLMQHLKQRARRVHAD